MLGNKIKDTIIIETILLECHTVSIMIIIFWRKMKTARCDERGVNIVR
jgi:hypothetical protein